MDKYKTLWGLRHWNLVVPRRAVATFDKRVSGHASLCWTFNMFLWRVQILWWGFSYIHGDDFVACDTGGDISAFLSKNLTPTLWERTTEKERDFLTPPSLSFFSEHQFNSNMFPEYNQHMYLLIITKEVWLLPLMYTFLSFVYCDSLAPWVFGNYICIYPIFKNIFTPLVLETIPYSRGCCCKACDLPVHLHNKEVLVTQEAIFPRAQLTSA